MSVKSTVTHVVHLQRTSPNFAEYCVTHIADPSHQFLFSTNDTVERRLYLRLLDEARVADHPHGATSQDDHLALGSSSSPPFTTHHGEPKEDRSGGAPRRDALAAEQSAAAAAMKKMTTTSLFTPSMKRPRGVFVFTQRDVHALWKALRQRFVPTFSSSSSTATAGSAKRSSRAESKKKTKKERERKGNRLLVVYGPHAPHCFATESELHRFFAHVLVVVERQQRADVEELVQHMTRRLPRTECFLYVLTYILVELLCAVEMGMGPTATANEKEGSPLHSSRDDGKSEPVQSEAARHSAFSSAEGNEPPATAHSTQTESTAATMTTTGGGSVSSSTVHAEAAGTTLFVLAALLAEHQRHHRLVCGTEGESIGTESSQFYTPSTAMGTVAVVCCYYQAAFEHYLITALRALSEAVRRNPQQWRRVCPALLSYAVDTMGEWCEEGWFSEESQRSLKRMAREVEATAP